MGGLTLWSMALESEAILLSIGKHLNVLYIPSTSNVCVSCMMYYGYVYTFVAFICNVQLLCIQITDTFSIHHNSAFNQTRWYKGIDWNIINIFATSSEQTYILNLVTLLFGAVCWHNTGIGEPYVSVKRCLPALCIQTWTNAEYRWRETKVCVRESM